MDGRTWTLRTAVVQSVGLLDPSCLCTVMVACPFLSRFFGMSLSFSPGNVVGRDSVHWACERVLELQCLTVTFCSAHGGLHADTQFLQLWEREFSFQFLHGF